VSPTFFKKKLAKFRQKTKLKIEIKKLGDFGGFSIAKSERKNKMKSPDFYTWFSICSQNIKV